MKITGTDYGSTIWINAGLERCYRYGYVDKIPCLSDLLNSVDLALFDKMQSVAHCLYPLLPQSEVNLNIYVVVGMTLFYPHVPKIFTRDLSSCVVCLILCNNYIVLFYCFIVLHIHSGFTSSFVFLLFLYVPSHMRLSSVNKYYLLTYLLTYLLKRRISNESDYFWASIVTTPDIVLYFDSFWGPGNEVPGQK